LLPRYRVSQRFSTFLNHDGGSMEEGEEGGSFSAPDDESDEGPPVQQSFARRGSALLGAIGRRFSGQVEMGVGVV
jgi:hypothetical protein